MQTQVEEEEQSAGVGGGSVRSGEDMTAEHRMLEAMGGDPYGDDDEDDDEGMEDDEDGAFAAQHCFSQVPLPPQRELFPCAMRRCVACGNSTLWLMPCQTHGQGGTFFRGGRGSSHGLVNIDAWASHMGASHMGGSHMGADLGETVEGRKGDKDSVCATSSWCCSPGCCWP